jgi:hypothetical protein
MYFTKILLSIVFVLFASTALAGKPENTLVCHVGNELGSDGETYMENPDCIIPGDWVGEAEDYICPDAGKIDLILVSKKAKHIGNAAHAFLDSEDFLWEDYPPEEGIGDDPADFEEGEAVGIDRGCELLEELLRIVFVTSGTYTGDLVTEAATLGLGDFTDDGLGAGDAICTKLGGDAGLPGSYTAWLSDSTTPAQDRVSHSNVPYVLTNGLQVAADYQDLTFEDATTCTGNGSADCLDHMIDRNESQGLVAQDQVWTSTLRDGTVNGVDFCDDWTSADGGLSGAVGITNGQNKNWTQQTGSYCNSPKRLYCFQD